MIVIDTVKHGPHKGKEYKLMVYETVPDAVLSLGVEKVLEILNEYELVLTILNITSNHQKTAAATTITDSSIASS